MRRAASPKRALAIRAARTEAPGRPARSSTMTSTTKRSAGRAHSHGSPKSRRAADERAELREASDDEAGQRRSAMRDGSRVRTWSANTSRDAEHDERRVGERGEDERDRPAEPPAPGAGPRPSESAKAGTTTTSATFA